MSQNEVILRFKDVSFRYEALKPILEEVSFSVRRNSKITIMGQNGGGKSTMFQMIAGGLKSDSGDVAIDKDTTIAIARQVIPRDELDLTVREFFEKCFSEKIYNIDPKIDDVLEVVNLKHHEKMHDRKISLFSGGQQARLLLASALIQSPDLLLLDEPTNNLDKEGIAHLTQFLKDYKKTVIVISHDADFLNAFTDGVLYLDIFTKKVEQYAGNYFDVVEQITIRNERENRKNARLAKEIQAKKDQANVFAHKGGQLRFVAKRMRERAEYLEENKVDIRKEDKAIRQFFIPAQEDLAIDILTIKEMSALDMKTHKPVKRKTNITVGKNRHLLLQGPNGIGKSTLLELIAGGKTKGLEIAAGTSVGYYRQDFSTLNFEDTVYESLVGAAAEDCTKENLRSVAAGFLITEDFIKSKIGSLSEGQKGLVAFARLVLQKPGLLILDEPTNHINFRHIPVIAEALNKYQGAMVLVSHVPEFVDKIRIDEVLDLEK
ncbi:MAG: ABC-F family ATP-binding cassette domain-containing protein [bacterium]|nr:ABC-F family ATP-binding cassette domain-containing protein [bacterium]